MSENLMRSATIKSTIVWEDNGEEKRASVQSLSRHSAKVELPNGKTKSVKWENVKRVED